MKQLPSNIKVLLVSLLPFFGAVIVLVLIMKFGFGKISEIRLKITTAKKDQTILTQKLNLLNEVSADILSSSSISAIALPQENPSLSVISQIKRLALDKGVSVSNLKTGGEVLDKSDLKRVDVSFEIQGPRILVLDFLASVEKIAPISLLDKVKLNEAGGLTRGTIVVKSFWAELPKKLPSLSEKINNLTNDERATLTNISQLIQPIFIEVPPADTSGRADPFTF